jgi:hypothetical protein
MVAADTAVGAIAYQMSMTPWLPAVGYPTGKETYFIHVNPPPDTVVFGVDGCEYSQHEIARMMISFAPVVVTASVPVAVVTEPEPD